MGGTALVSSESKIQDNLDKKDKIISSCYEFAAALKKQFYPLGYMQQAVMDWKNLRQGRGQSVQEDMEMFRKKVLSLGIFTHMKLY